MKDTQIIIEPVQFIQLDNLSIYKKNNDHARATIMGIIPQECEDECERLLMSNTYWKIKVKDEMESETFLFVGIIEEGKLHHQNELVSLEVSLISCSFLMDQVECNRSFQNAQMTYQQVLNFEKNAYGSFSFIMTTGENEQIGDIIIQYCETDWAFAKRMASRLGTSIIPACEVTGVKYWVGIPNRSKVVDINPIRYTTRKALGEHIYKTRNGLDNLVEQDSVYYEIEDREIYEIGQAVKFKNRVLYVYEVQTRLEGAELLHRYLIKEKSGFCIPRQYNSKQSGASIEGHVIDVLQDKVKVHLSIDEYQETSTAKWFDYSTVYSSPDGTGWYAMPEIGDAVRLYLPNETEEEGYIISAVHLVSTDENERSNPDHKSIKTKYGKEVLFTPSSLTLTNNKGMSIEILDGEGINIVSNKKISIISDESVAVASMTADIQVIAPESISIVQGETQINLQENVAISGAQLSVQE